jgi:hypothetical protein
MQRTYVDCGKGPGENAPFFSSAGDWCKSTSPTHISGGRNLDAKATMDRPLGTWWQSVSGSVILLESKGTHLVSEDLLDKFAIFQEKLYFYMSKIPRWMYLILSGSLGSLFLNLFHRKKPTTIKPVTTKSKPTGVTSVQQDIAARAGSSSVGTKREGIQTRKSNKK